MNKKTLVSLFFLLTFSGAAWSQTAKAFERQGDKAMEQKSYWTASTYFAEALSIKKEDAGLLYKYANSCRLRFALEEAAKTYEQLTGRPENQKQFPLVHYYLATVQKHQGQYEKAGETFKSFLKKYPDKKSYYYQKAKQEIDACQWAQSALQVPVEAEITHLDEKVNTRFSEFAPHKAEDLLYFSSLRFQKTEKEGFEQRFSRLLTTDETQKARTLTGTINQAEMHTANSAFSEDGQRFYFTQCVQNESAEIRCKIYVREKKNDQWSRPEALPAPVNLEEYTTTHPFITLDQDGSEMLFFASDRPGGQGKLDIWFVKQRPDGQFETPQNAGPVINSMDQEMSPFFHKESQTLFFSSDWHEGFGGLDVFSAKWNKDQSWAPPVNLGSPINSTHHDFHLWLENDLKSGYFSSNRPGSLSMSDDDACCHDIYFLKSPTLLPEPEQPPVEDTFLITRIDPEIELEPEKDPLELPPVGIEPEPTPTLESFLPIPLYFHNDEPDSNTTKVSTDVNYEDNFLFYYRLKNQYVREFAKGDMNLQSEVENFFENEVKAGMENLRQFAEILAQRLENGEQLKVAIRGFTSPRAPAAYNVSLAKRRINSIQNYLNIFENGRLKPYLQSGQLLFETTPFGETTAPPGISDDYKDRRNSIYSINASRERRVEIYEVKLKD